MTESTTSTPAPDAQNPPDWRAHLLNSLGFVEDEPIVDILLGIGAQVDDLINEVYNEHSNNPDREARDFACDRLFRASSLLSTARALATGAAK